MINEIFVSLIDMHVIDISVCTKSTYQNGIISEKKTNQHQL